MDRLKIGLGKNLGVCYGQLTVKVIVSYLYLAESIFILSDLS